MTNSAADQINEKNGFSLQDVRVIGKLSIDHRYYWVTTVPHKKSIMENGMDYAEDFIVCSICKNLGSDDVPLYVEEFLILSAPWTLRLFALPDTLKIWIQKETLE
jgi:hypothetical protein